MTITPERIAARCRDDGEFRLAARHWDGALSLDLGDRQLDFVIEAGIIRAGRPPATVSPVSLAAPAGTWTRILAPVPPPFFNDIMPARAFGLQIDGPTETFWQYYPAIRRLVDLLREEAN